jgi:enamine deaminase RidA (YjgF/YER057c/UK114 family)
MMEICRKRFPDLRPTWTAIGVAGLRLKGMVVEIQAEATIL